jgi:DNA modification methylase
VSDKNSGSFGGRTVSNVAWLGGSQFLRQGISIGASLLIARLLAPSDYGVFAMTVFVNELAQLLINFGMEAAGCKFAQMLIWLKTHAVMGRLDYLPQHEILLYGWYGTHAFRKSKDKSILIYPKPSKSVLHPTMKPVGLLRRLILNSSKIGDLMYDPFGGSGSTLIAAQDTKRHCAMIEMDAKYCRVIIDRFEKHTGVKARPLSKLEYVR